MQVLGCSTAVVPCPPSDQAWMSLAELMDPAALGLTTQAFEKVFGFGFGAVLMFFLIGVAIGAAVGVVKSV